MMIPDNWGELLEPGLRRIFEKHLKQLPDYVAIIFNVENSKKAAEYNMGTGGLGAMDAWEDSGNQVSYEDIDKGFKSTYLHKKFSKGFKVQRELLEDDLYNEIKKRPRGLARSAWYTRQVHGASVFNLGFTSFLGPDGKPLFSSAHPIAPGSSTTFSNVGTDALSATAVETGRTTMLGWKDDKGNLLAVNPDTLIVPTALRKSALVIADSDKEPSTANNDVNVWKGSLNVIEWKFLTDTNAWFLADSARMEEFLHFYMRRNPVLQADKETFNDEVSAFKVVSRWSYGFDDPTFVYGSNPS